VSGLVQRAIARVSRCTRGQQNTGEKEENDETRYRLAQAYALRERGKEDTTWAQKASEAECPWHGGLMRKGKKRSCFCSMLRLRAVNIVDGSAALWALCTLGSSDGTGQLGKKLELIC
jgi:hypothetical protein